MYNIPEYNINFKSIAVRVLKSQFFLVVFLILVIFVALNLASGNALFHIWERSLNMVLLDKVIKTSPQTYVTEKVNSEYVSRIEYEEAIIEAVKKASPSVVSIIISKNLPVYEQQFINPFGNIPGFDFQIPQYVQKGTELKEIGAGSGFIVSEDGLVLTNKHVVREDGAEYTIITNSGKKYNAKVLALDPVQDLAVIKIQSKELFQAITLGDSSKIQVGQGAIAIGNALGKFSNTVSVGVVSGLERTIDASNQTGSFSERLEGIIQTDAAINQGNSGGPLINLRGEVIGVNVATAQDSQTIGFAIPINVAKRGIAQVIVTNKITYPFLGIRYILVNDAVKNQHGLTVNSGVLILSGPNGEPAITKGSAAQKAGLKEKDVIIEINGEKVNENNSLSRIIQKYNPGDMVVLKVIRGGTTTEIEVVLGERS